MRRLWDCLRERIEFGARKVVAVAVVIIVVVSVGGVVAVIAVGGGEKERDRRILCFEVELEFITLIAYLHRKGDTKINDNYRTLSLLSHIGKIQERMILRRMDELAEETNAYGKTQQGFRHGRGCADARL